MSDEVAIEFNIQIFINDATADQLDMSTRNILRELRELNIESANLVKTDSIPVGAKSGDVILAGTIAVATLPTLLPKIVDLIQAWVMRDQNRAVKFKGRINNQAVEFEGSSQDLQKLISTFSKAKKNR